MKSYLNFKGETVDQINQSDFSSVQEYRNEKRRLLSEYKTAFNSSDLYWSQRPCKNWSN